MNRKKITAGMIAKMAAQSLRTSRMHNVSVMITIILASSLLCTILMFASGQQQQVINQLSHQQHASYYNLTPEQTEALKNDGRISFQVQLKTGMLTPMDGFDILPYYISRLSDEIRLVELESGNLPVSADEAALPAALLRQMDLAPVPGSRVTFSFYDGSTETFTVSGILKSSETAKQYPLLCSAAYAATGSQLKDTPPEVCVKIKDARSMSAEECKETIYDIGKDAGIERKYIIPSKAFLDSLSVDGQSAMIYGLTGAVILLACFLVIYGVFYLSVTSRIHQSGQLRTIGMTRKQIRTFVSMEGGILFLRSAPFGVITGCIAGYLIIPDGFQMTRTLLTAALVFAIVYLVTMVSVHKPARIAASVSPVEALRYMPQDTMKQAGNKKLCRRLTPAGLGMMNFSKNKKKVAITMLSLSLGGILYITAASYITSFDMTRYARQGYFRHAEFHICYAPSASSLSENGVSSLQADHPMDSKLIRRICGLDGVRTVTELKEAGIRYDFPRYGEYGAANYVYPMDETECREAETYLEEGAVTHEKLMSGDYILVFGNSTVQEIYGWKFAPGDVLAFHYYDGRQMCEKEVTILGILNDQYMLDHPYLEGWFVMPETTVSKMIPHNHLNAHLLVSVDPEQEHAAGEQLDRIIAENSALELETLEERRIFYSKTANQIFTVITSLALFIMTFSILSMINTLMTNIITRRQELAMLASIGMEQRQIRRMLLGESLLLVTVTSGVTITVGTACSYGLVRMLYTTGAFYMSFRFPVLFILAYAAVLVLVPLAITFVSVHSFSKETLTERLRSAENG